MGAHLPIPVNVFDFFFENAQHVNNNETIYDSVNLSSM